MGSSLRRQLREALPPSIKGLQRAVALEIADDARYDDDWHYAPETGRRSRVRLADLVRWTAAKDELSIREMLRRLSLAGWEFRIPIGKDKNGNLLYAVPGKAMTFRVPDFEGPTTVGPDVEIEAEGPTVVGPEGSEGPTESGQGPTVVEVGPTVVGAGPTVVGAGPTSVGPPSPVSSISSKESPSSSVAEVVEGEIVDGADEQEEGGGGDLSTRSIAEQIVAALDYRGQTPNRKQQETLTARLVAALDRGWTIEDLADYLRLKGAVDSAYALYAYRLKPDVIPDPPQPQPAAVQNPPPAPPAACQACLDENPAARVNPRLRLVVIDGTRQPCPDCHPSRVAVDGNNVADLYPPRPFAGDPADGGLWERAAARAEARSRTLTGTDAIVQGWHDLSLQLAAEENLSTADQRVIQGQAIAAKFRAEEKTAITGPGIGRNYSNDIWRQPADPAEAAKIPHCGAPNCDPVTRLKTEPDWSGEPHTALCGDCHPALKLS